MAYKEEKFELNQNSTGITESDGLGATWAADIWDFKPPLNTFLKLKPTDIFSCYLVGDDAAEMPAATQVRIVKRDAANEDAKPVLSACLYQRVKEFQDKGKFKRLTLDREVEVGPDEHLVVMVNGADAAGTGDLDASASNFRLQTTRRRRPLG